MPGNGSAAFIGEKALLTAAHVVNHPEADTMKSATVYPGGTGSTFGSDTVVNMYTPAQWDKSYDENYDYAVILISKNLKTGAFGTKANTDSALSNKAVWAYGYPGDKTRGTLWYDSGYTASVLKAGTFFYTADSVQGDSGGPIVLQSDYLYIAGIVSQDTNSNKYNQAKRVTSDVVEMDLKYSG